MRPAFVGLLLCLLAASAAAAPAAGKLAATQTGPRIDILVGGEFFTSYRCDPDEKLPFLFPVNGPSGASVTSMRNGRYPHHASIFFGCDRVNGGNYWQDRLETGRIVSAGAVLAKNTAAEVVVTDTCLWQRPGAEPPLRDRRRIAFSAPAPDLRQIDFEIELEALADVVIGKTNHSLLGVRLDPDLAPAAGGTLVDAAGRIGESGTFGQTSPWLAAYGPRARGRPEGLAVFQHPSNPGAPAPWFTRDYGFLSPTPMYWPADGVATRLARGQRLALRYRILIFAGDPAALDFAARFAAYAAETPVPFPP